MVSGSEMHPRDSFLHARNFLLTYREDYEKVYREFKWPDTRGFNWAIDWFDFYAQNNQRTALWLARENGPQTRLSFSELSERSSQVANFLVKRGAKKGDALLLMLPNAIPLWEVLLAAIKLGILVVPTSMQVTVSELKDRLERGKIKIVVTDESGAEKLDALPPTFIKILTGKKTDWICLEDAYAEETRLKSNHATDSNDPCLLYFTSGTTAKPKLVLHTQRSYPIGHLSTMYWIGIKEGDTHQNISSPGWAKHAWSSFFAPWNAGATIFVHETPRFQPASQIRWLHQAKVNTLCAPPTVWRMMLLEPLGPKPTSLCELASAGEPLNPEVIEKIRNAWGITIRDGYGQTETTAQVGNPPGAKLKPGSMGRPLPGYQVAILDGEIALRIEPRPAGLMTSYLDDLQRTQNIMKGGFYRTGDEATQDDEGYIFFVGRGDDVFKSSDYRLSPFELESVLMEHSHVAEAAVVPSPDAIRLSVPKAFVTLKPGIPPTREAAASILQETNQKMAAYKRIRKIEFGELPKTSSGKIRRVQLRQREENGEKGVEFLLSEI